MINNWVLLIFRLILKIQIFFLPSLSFSKVVFSLAFLQRFRSNRASPNYQAEIYFLCSNTLQQGSGLPSKRILISTTNRLATSDLCPHFCLQKWNLLCNWDHQATCVRVQYRWHGETVLSNISHGGGEVDIQMSIYKWLQQDRRTDQVVQGESTLYTGCLSESIAQLRR